MHALACIYTDGLGDKNYIYTRPIRIGIFHCFRKFSLFKSQRFRKDQTSKPLANACNEKLWMGSLWKE